MPWPVDFHNPASLWWAVPFLGVTWCLLLLWLIAHLGGWSRLARFHRTDDRPEGSEFHWCSLHFAPGLGYNHCLNAVLSREGVYLKPLFILRFAHPALLIPWERIGTVQKTRVLFWTDHYLPIYAAGRRFKLYLPAAAKDWLDGKRSKSA